MGVRGLVIDPYNYIAQSQKVENEHQGINDMLTRLVAFARRREYTFGSLHTQPKCLQIKRAERLYQRARTFLDQPFPGRPGITVHRNKNKDVEVHCWKVGFKWLGRSARRC